MITKDFHLTKDFPRIRGKSFVIMEGALVSVRLSGHIGHVFGPGKARGVIEVTELALRLVAYLTGVGGGPQNRRSRFDSGTRLDSGAVLTLWTVTDGLPVRRGQRVALRHVDERARARSRTMPYRWDAAMGQDGGMGPLTVRIDLDPLVARQMPRPG